MMANLAQRVCLQRGLALFLLFCQALRSLCLQSTVVPGIPFFASRVRLSTHGAQEVWGCIAIV